MEINLCVAGFGGQGIMSLGKILADATCNSTELNVSFYPSYGAEQRGGTANCYVVISDENIGNPMPGKVDDLIVMNGPSLEKFLPNLRPGGRLFVNTSIATGEIERKDISVVNSPVTEMAFELGNSKVLNIIMLGIYIGYTGIVDADIIKDTIVHKFEGKKQDIIDLNKKAFDMGLELGRKQRG